MSATATSAAVAVPVKESTYILFYRHGMNPQCQKGFKLNGDLRAAVDRAKKHCEVMGYRYIFVRPLVCDLEAEEKQKTSSNG